MNPTWRKVQLPLLPPLANCCQLANHHPFFTKFSRQNYHLYSDPSKTGPAPVPLPQKPHPLKSAQNQSRTFQNGHPTQTQPPTLEFQQPHRRPSPELSRHRRNTALPGYLKTSA
ncbi:hypothetical protein KSP40_PGU003564 [Platanthera guangdongensis]|uniref:Uncharacterized protein n=1 Tax=Platanthera guangdongensis TaxID=2320717 RepID=A0ABR2M3Y2_9ASPA